MGRPKRRNLPDLSDLAVTGVRIAVKVTPRAAANAILRQEAGLKVSVTAVPENGRATEAVRSLLAKAMGVAATRLELQQGAASRNKVFVYTGDG
ncbi:DUF167 domain-containing protein [Phaeobacter sp. 11ANDIMAR09]|uniref:DUF167 domain-containing protein n=1 Tax=Phaeobacter sp. 11ANDIMAR09 TaxID=1225647 RepID=UPI0006C8B2B6|nr:DUF167 domain-containing protein [Phaeobacter sp. 11ANDIMAR09]KPD13775.1 hypothetical protein AN476_03690 [Phaeobacter sp. 11ANDIMAR09]OIQ35671.1 MAG: hypothetical protein BM559_00705 [Roseobacter sp. MedPE-SWchi]